MTALLIDVGGVLSPDHWGPAAEHWAGRLGITPEAFLSAVFGGNDDQVLIGRMSEDAWWEVVAGRLRIDGETIRAIRADLAGRQTWDAALLDCLRSLRGRVGIALVSNAWGLADGGVRELADAVVLSCDVGYAKPDPRIYTDALQRLGAEPAEALFVDDTPGHVEAARSLGMAGHVHGDTAQTIARVMNTLCGLAR